ncbi:MAG: hypothetical protein KDE54_02400 [Caldilineaceae bacterium]|nr:hypothetical protein [Caldilineaceae bacterium]MCB0143063.1 hypothetical protein [Caldilineaceae bacterium]
MRDQVLAREGDYFDGVQAGVFPELGQGTINWQGIRRILEEMNYQGWGTVEQDILLDTELTTMDINPLESAKRNRAYLRRELGW